MFEEKELAPRFTPFSAAEEMMSPNDQVLGNEVGMWSQAQKDRKLENDFFQAIRDNANASEEDRFARADKYFAERYGIETTRGAIINSGSDYKMKPFETASAYENALVTLAEKGYEGIASERYKALLAVERMDDEKAKRDEILRLADIPTTEWVDAEGAIPNVAGAGTFATRKVERPRSKEDIDADIAAYRTSVLSENYMALFERFRPDLSEEGESLVRDVIKNGSISPDNEGLFKSLYERDPRQGELVSFLVQNAKETERGVLGTAWRSAKGLAVDMYWNAGKTLGDGLYRMGTGFDAMDYAWAGSNTDRLARMNRDERDEYERLRAEGVEEKVALDKVAGRMQTRYFNEMMCREDRARARRVELAIKDFASLREWEHYDYWDNSFIGAATTIPYMAVTAIPYAGFVVNVASHMQDVEDQIIREGGDPEKAKVARFIGAVTWAAIEKLELKGFTRSLSRLEKTVMWRHLWHGEMKKALGELGQAATVAAPELIKRWASETGQEGLQGGIEAIERDLGFDKKTSEIFEDAVTAVWDDTKNSAGTMAIITPLFPLVGGAVRIPFQRRRGLDQQSVLAYIQRQEQLKNILNSGYQPEPETPEMKSKRIKRLYNELTEIWGNSATPMEAMDKFEEMGYSEEDAQHIARYFDMRSAILREAAANPNKDIGIRDALIAGNAFRVGQDTTYDPVDLFHLINENITTEEVEVPTPGAPNAAPQKGIRVTVPMKNADGNEESRTFTVITNNAAPNIELATFASSVEQAMKGRKDALTAEEYLALSLEDKTAYLLANDLKTGGDFQVLDANGKEIFNSDAIIKLARANSDFIHKGGNWTLAHETAHTIVAFARQMGMFDESSDNVAVMRRLFGEATNDTEAWNEEAMADAFAEYLRGKYDFKQLAPEEASFIRKCFNAIIDFFKEAYFRLTGQESPAAIEVATREEVQNAVFEGIRSGDFSGLAPWAGVEFAEDKKKTKRKAKNEARTVANEKSAQPKQDEPRGQEETKAPQQTPATTADIAQNEQAADDAATEENADTNADEGDEYQRGFEAGLAQAGLNPTGTIANKPVRAGAKRTVFTPDYQQSAECETMWVSLDDLIESTDDREVQMRDRNRVATDMQVLEKTRKGVFQPLALFPGTKSDDGAPIVGGGLRIISGHGRKRMLQVLAQEGRYNEYLDAINAECKKQGIPTAPEGMKNPVLVLRVTGGLENRAALVKFAERSNRWGGLERSGAEFAESDARQITPELMSLYAPDASGNLLAASNRPFMATFLNAVGATGLTNADGTPTPEAALRVQRALMTALFGNDENIRSMVRSLLEQSGDLGLGNLQNALMKSAGQLIALKNGRASYDIVDNVREAAIQYIAWRAALKNSPRLTLGEHLLQGDFFAAAPSQMTQSLTRLFEAGRFGAVLARYAKLAAAQDVDAQMQFLEKATPLQILAQAERDVVEKDENGNPVAPYVTPDPNSAEAKVVEQPPRFSLTVRRAMNDLAGGKDYGILENEQYGKIRFPLGRYGKRGFGLLHIIEQRMTKDGATLDEAVDTAFNVATAATIGKETDSRKNTRHLDYNGTRAIIGIMPDNTIVITGYEIDTDDSVVAKQRAAKVAPQPYVRSEEVIRALKRKLSSANSIPYLGAGAQGGIRNAPRGAQKSAGVNYPSAADEIRAYPRFSIGKKAREDAIALIKRKRPDLTGDTPEKTVDEIGKFATSKEQKAALHWFIKGAIRLPEDAPKVTEALGYAERAKGKGNTDALSYDSPMAMINALHDFKPKAKPIDPDTVPQLSDKKELGYGVVTYLVQDDREGQKAMREIINTHWGEDANPWCLLQGDGKGNLATYENSNHDAWYYWQTYSAVPKRVAFKDGKLHAFMAGDESALWWDRQDSSHLGIPMENRPVPNDPYGRWADYELYSDGSIGVTQEPSSYDNGIRYRKQINGKTVTEWFNNGNIAFQDLGDKVNLYYYSDGLVERILIDGFIFEFEIYNEMWKNYGVIERIGYYEEGDIPAFVYIPYSDGNGHLEIRSGEPHLASAAEREKILKQIAPKIAEAERIYREKSQNPPSGAQPRFSIRRLSFADATENEAKETVKALRTNRVQFTNKRNERKAELKSDWTKIFSGPAKKKSVSYEAHYAAANHINTLFEEGVKLWEEPPRNASRDIRAYAKYGCPFVLHGEPYLAKLTVKEYADEDAVDGVYSVEALSVEKISGRGINVGITSIEGHELDPAATAELKRMLQSTDTIIPQNGVGTQGQSAADGVRRLTTPSSLTLSHGSSIISPTKEIVDEVRRKHEGIDETLREYGIADSVECLTQSQCRYLASLSPNTLRDRIAEARPQGNEQNGEGTLRGHSTVQEVESPRASVRRGSSPMKAEDIATGYLAARFLAGKDTSLVDATSLLRNIGLKVDTQAILDRAKDLAENNRDRLRASIESRNPEVVAALARESLADRATAAFNDALMTGAKAADPDLGVSMQRAAERYAARELQTAKGFTAAEMSAELPISLAEGLIAVAEYERTPAEKARLEAAKAKREEEKKRREEVGESPLEESERFARDTSYRAPTAEESAYFNELMDRARFADDARKAEALRKELAEKKRKEEKAKATAENNSGEVEDNADEGAENEGGAFTTADGLPFDTVKRIAPIFESADLFAQFIVEWATDHILKKHSEFTSRGELWRSPIAIKELVKTAQYILRDLSKDTLGSSYARNRADQMIINLVDCNTFNSIRRNVALIYDRIHSNALRISRHKLVRELINGKHDSKDDGPGFKGVRQLAGIKGRFRATLEKDERTIDGKTEQWARWLVPYLTMSEEKLKAEEERLLKVIATHDTENEENGYDKEDDARYTEAKDRLALLRVYGGMVRWLPGKIIDARADILEQLSGKRAQFEQEREARKAENKAIRDAIIAAVEAGAGNAFHNHGADRVANFLDSMNGNLTLEMQNMIRYCKDEKKREAALLAIEDVATLISRGSEQYRVVLNTARKEINEGLTACYGNAEKGVKHLMSEKIPEEAALAIFKTREKVPTYGQLLQLYATTLQKDYKINADEHGRTAQLALMEKTLTPQDIQFHAWAVNWYAANRQSLSDSVEEITGVKITSPDRLYCPAKMDRESDGFSVDAVAWSPVPSALNRRIAHKLDFDESANLLALLLKQADIRAQTIGYGMVGIRLRDIIAHHDLQKAVRMHVGRADIKRVTDHMKDVLVQDATKSERYEWLAPLNVARKWVSRFYLSLNIPSAIKQLASMPVWANAMLGGQEVGLKRCLGYLTSVGTAEGRQAIEDLIRSDGFKARYRMGWSEEIQNLLSHPSKFRLMRWIEEQYDKGMIVNKGVDVVSCLWMAQGFYRDALDLFTRRGFSPEKAKECALAYTWSVCENGQQSGRTENMNRAQRHGGALVGAIFQFKTAFLLQGAYVSQAIKDVLAGTPGAKGRLARAIFINTVYIPAFSAVVDAVRDAVLGEPEPPEDPDKMPQWLKDFCWSMVDGVTAPLFITGSIIHAGFNAIFGKTGYDDDARIPSVDEIMRISKHGSAAFSSAISLLTPFDIVEEVTPEKVQEDLMRLASDFSAPVRHVRKYLRNRQED